MANRTSMFKKAILTLTACVSLTIAHTSQAALGWTLEECKQHFKSDGFAQGKNEIGLDAYQFNTQGFWINVTFKDDKVVSVIYAAQHLSDRQIDNLLKNNAPGATWRKVDKGLFPDPKKPTYWQGSADGVDKFFSVLTTYTVFGTPLERLQVSTAEINDLITQREDSTDL